MIKAADRASSRRRALVCAFTFSPDRNGVANAAGAQAAMLQRLDYDVEVVTCTPGPAQIPGPTGAIPVHRMSLRRNPRIIQCGGKDVEAVRQVLQGGPWDVMLVHAWQNKLTNAVLAVPDLKQRSKRTILVSHGLSTRANYHRPPLNYVNRLSWVPYERWQLPRQMAALDELVLLSARVDDDRFLDAKLAPLYKVRTHVVPNAAQIDDSASSRPAMIEPVAEGLSKGYLLSIGNYSFAKNERFVLEAYAAIKHSDIPLIFVGQRENAYLRTLKQRAARLNLRHVHFLHGLSKNEIDWLYAHASLLLAGSRTECQPLVLLDAMAAGVPFISTNVGCVSELAGGIAVEDSVEMASKIDLMLESASRRATMAQEGKAMAEAHYSLPAHERRWLAVLGRGM